MLAEILRKILIRDVKALKRELEAYPDEPGLWLTPPGVSNSAGNLALHLAGNLRTFIGAQLGSNGYLRDREAEFSRRDVPRTEVLAQLDAAMQDIDATMPRVTDEDMSRPYPMPIGGVTLTTGEFLTHIAAHLAYHLGQVDYHRRVVTGEPGKIGAVMPTELK